MKFLLSHGADVTAVTTSQMNALHGACEGGRVETVRVLMEHVKHDQEKRTAITMQKNSDGKTAWDVAMGTKNKSVLTVLKEMGDVNGASSSCSLS